MATFTPRPPSRKSRLSLTAKEYTKITHTIASVRRSRVPTEHEQIDEESDDYIEEEPSFLAEKSFVKAPLNSRLGLIPPPTPRNKGKERAQQSLEDLSVELQEALILEDLLHVLTGIEGTYIIFDEDYVPDEADEITLIRGPKYAVEQTLNPSLRDLVERILPLATYYNSVRTFIELRSSLEFGLVNHALCAGLRDMLKDYQTLMAQIEHAFNTSPEFSLQKLWFYVHPTLHTLSLLHKLVLALSPSSGAAGAEESEEDSDTNESDDEAAQRRRAALGLAPLPPSLRKAPSPNGQAAPSLYSEFPIVGGEVLTILSSLKQLHSGDPDATTVYNELWRKSGIPYAQMLNMWVRKGVWKDRWEEGCIRETKWSGIAAGGDEEWERRYTLRDGSSLTTSKTDRMSSALPSQAPVGVPAPRPFLTPLQLHSNEKRLPGGACIPPELEQWKFKILLAGKYLNVIRACGLDFTEKEDSTSPSAIINKRVDPDVDLGGDEWRKQIEEAYTHANVTLLALLIGVKNPQHQSVVSSNPPPRQYAQPTGSHKDSPHPSPLPPALSQGENTLLLRLRSLRHFFFLAQSSYLSHFLELAAVELRKSTKSVGVTRLQPLLDVALAAEGAPFREDVRVFVGNSGGLYDWLLKIVSVQGLAVTEQPDEEEKREREKEKEKEKDDSKKEKSLLAIDALCLDYAVPFPLSLVISRSTLMRYQIIFRFLLHLKHIERSLSLMWMDQKLPIWRCSLPGNVDLDKWRKSLFILRTRMLVFVQQILNFATLDVLEPNWKKFEDRMRSVRTVDDLLRDHVDFLDTCLKGCMLTSSKLLKTYSRLIITCSTFAMYSNQFTTSASAAISQLDDPDGAASPKEMTKRWDFLNKFQQHFDHWLTNFADIVQFFASSENVALLPLVTRLSQSQLLNRKETSQDTV